MHATPTKSTIKLTTTSTTKLTPSSSPTTSPSIIGDIGSTKTIKTSVTKKTSTTTLKGLNANETTASKEIEEISKKISEHADAIYRTWKVRGLAPTEILDIYTNAATVQVAQGGADIFGGSVEAAAAATSGTTEGLQQLVSQFVIKDKEQRGVKTISGGSGSGAVSGLSFLKSQRTDSTTTTAQTMPENIGSKMTQKHSVGNALSGGVLKQTTRASGIQKPTATSSSTSSSSSSAILLKSSNNNNNDQASVKKLAKSSTANTTTSSSSLSSSSTSSSTPTASSIKNNACVKNVNSSIVGVGSKHNANTAATPTTVKRTFGKSAITNTTTNTTAPTLDINLNLDLGFDDLQLDVNSLSHLQTQNLKKIKELLKENENGNETIKEPKKATTTKIATKTKRPNSPAKSESTSMTVTDSQTIKLKTTINDHQQQNNTNNNDVSVKKIAKNLNNNKSKISNNNNNHGITNNNITKSIGETNDATTISKLISTNDKMNNTAGMTTMTPTIINSNNKQQQAGAKATTTIKSTIEKSPTIRGASSQPTSTATIATTTTTKTTNVGERAHQSIKVINSISNGSQADQQQSQNEQNVAVVAVTQKLNKKDKKDKENNNSNSNSNSNSNNNNKINEIEIKNKLIKVEKTNNSSNNNNNNLSIATLKAAIEETAVATANVMEIARQSNNINTTNSINISRSSSSSSNTSSSNMPAPTKFKSGRATPGAAQDKNLKSPFLTRGSVAERVLMFEKCPNVRHSFLNINRPDPADAPPKSLLKAKLHATPPPPQEQRTLQQEIRSTKSVYIPRFYFPHGKPQPQIAQERTLRNILGAFDSYPNNQVTKDDLPRILKLCGLPFYWRMPIVVYCQQPNNVGLVERQRFVEFWKQMNVYCHDAASRFVYILSRGQRFRSYIIPEDMVPLVQDVVDTHPGLAFLKEATEFHSRYVHTVIARIFYSVNRCWSGKITMSELKKSDLLEIISLLEEEDDINQIMAFFSYEHFYVIYCKFWELDKDHDLLINQDDLARHSDHALSTRIVERIFSGCVTRSDNKKNANDEPKMSYTDFVWFLLSEEDKRTPTAIEYWFRCMDLDGDGVLSMYELEYFYEEQQQRMESIGIETLPFEDCLCQMLDMIKPQNRDAITLGDLKRCKMTHVFFDTFFNLEKYLDHEQRDPFASQRDEYTSDWDRFAAQEYELLISEEND